jgi:putative transposase
MRKSRFSEEQMVAILREADRTSVAEAAKKHKVSEPTIYAWRKQFGQLEVQDVKRLKALELENSRLKKLLAERDLDTSCSRRSTQKNGEPAGPTRPARAPARAWSWSSSGVRAARNVASYAQLPAPAAGQGRAHHRCDEGTVGAVPALRLSRHPDLSAPTWLRAELVVNASALETGRAAGSAQATSKAYRVRQAAHPHTVFRGRRQTEFALIGVFKKSAPALHSRLLLWRHCSCGSRKCCLNLSL